MLTSALKRRTPYGVRGLKFFCHRDHNAKVRRTPYGVRGLKYLRQLGQRVIKPSHSVWSAWIEIPTGSGETGRLMVALRMECVD